MKWTHNKRGAAWVKAFFAGLSFVWAGVFVEMAQGAESRAKLASDEPLQGAALLKTDVMVVLAHPDDETGMATALAYYGLGQGKVVSAVYCTRGEGGGNMTGTQAGPALGLLREAELRDCLSLLGVRYCFFLEQDDFAYTESSRATLVRWDTDDALGRLVRLVRVLRPEVILTMNPAPHPGQHGHHQAAGMLATEAFDAAADPGRYPDQLEEEGLSPWQSRKLYYSGTIPGAFTVATLHINDAVARGMSLAQLTAKALSNHRSQGFGDFQPSAWLQRPQTFTLVKSILPFKKDETNLLQGLEGVFPPSTLGVNTSPARGSQPPVTLRFVPRPAIGRFTAWAEKHQVDGLFGPFPADIAVVSGEPTVLELEITNESGESIAGSVLFNKPAKWQVQPASLAYRIPARKSGRLQFEVIAPESRESVEMAATTAVLGNSFLATATLNPVPKLRIPLLREPPALDGGTNGWEAVPAHAIGPDHRFQGRIADATDCSATFQVGHHERILYVRVEVKDDRLVSNIAPNDIRGHWRTDSIELCIDPSAKAEDTFSGFKLGIFPFDTAGKVRGARDADARPGPIERVGPNIRLSSARTLAGYRVVTAVPFDDIGLPDPAPERIGFNVIIYDGDKSDAAPGENINEGRLAWAPRAGVMGRPEDWGRADLGR